MKPKNKPALTKVLTDHVVAGTMDAAGLMAAVKAGAGKAALKTVSGGTLTAAVVDGAVKVMDGAAGHVLAALQCGSIRSNASPRSKRFHGAPTDRKPRPPSKYLAASSKERE